MAIGVFATGSQKLDDDYWRKKKASYAEIFGNFDENRSELTEKEKNGILKFLLEDYDKTERAGMGVPLDLSVSFYVQG